MKIKIHRYLIKDKDRNSGGFEEFRVSVPKDESILELVRSIAFENPIIHGIIFDEKNQKINSYIAVILNGRFINPYDRLEATLQEGDEVTFLPILDGG